MTVARRDPPFFVLGAARSGTTMLRLMLNRHPRLAIPPESHFLLPILDELPIDGPLTLGQRIRAAQIITAHPRFRTWRVSAIDLALAFSAAHSASLSDLVDCAFRLQITDSRKPRWGDKTPRYYPRWGQLAALFPESAFIHIIRDGRDVSASLERVGWHGPGEAERAAYWAGCVRLAFECHLGLGDKRSIIVRYEDLVLDGAPCLRRICSFLGEDFAAPMLDFYLDALHQVSGFDGPVHDKLARPPEAGDVEIWRTAGSPDRLASFEAIAGRELSSAGYPLCFDTASGPEAHNIHSRTDQGSNQRSIQR